MSEPEFTTVIGTRNTSGDGTAIIPAPAADKEIRMYFVQMQAHADGAVSATIKGGSTAKTYVRCATAPQGKMREYTDRNCIRCGAGLPAYLHLDANVEVGYEIDYLLAAV